MARVKIKTTNNKSHQRKRDLLEILARNDIYVTRIIPSNDGFIILTNDNSELDKVFNGTTDKTLMEKEFTPIIPPQLKANRAVLIFKVDNHIFQHDETTMRDELIEKNE